MSTKFNKRQLPDSTVYNDEETTFQAKVLLPIATPTDDKEAITFKFYKDEREEIDTALNAKANISGQVFTGAVSAPNLSGTNTGDETTSSIQTKRPLKTIEGQSLEGVGDINLNKSDVGLGNVDNTSDLNKPISTATQTVLNALQLNKEDKANKNIANGYAGLDSSGKIIPTQLPALAITDTFVVASQAEQLALVAEVGDIAVRTDLNKSFILRVTGASTLANWQELLSPTSVDQTIIDGSTNSVSGNAVFDALALKSNIGHTHVASQITDLSKASVGLGNVDNTSDLSKPLSTATQTALNGKENAFSKNTAFNKPFGITAGTVVEGGTLGSNAYNSTAYLPLTGGTLSGVLNLNDGIGLVLGSESTSRLRFITSSGVNYIQSGTGSGYGTRADLVITGNYGGNETVRFKADGTTIFSNSLTATSFIKSSAPTTNLLLAGGGDIAQSTFQPAITGLATNYLPKWNGSGFWNSQIFDNGGNVGIGTTTPNSKFDVAGVISSSLINSYPTIAVLNEGTVGFPLFQLINVKNGVQKGWNIENGRTVNGDLGFYNVGGERVIIKDNGRVLINKTDDDLTNQLQVAGTISASPATTANQVVVKSQLDAVAGTSGSYTPTLTPTNAVSVVLKHATYQKIGNIVTVRISVYFTPTSTTLYSGIECTLPFNRATALTNNMGSGVIADITAYKVAIVQSMTTTTTNLLGLTGTLNSVLMSVVFQYSILE